MPKQSWAASKRKAATPDAFSKLRAEILDAQLQLSELDDATLFLANNVRRQRAKLTRLINKYKTLTAYGPQREGNEHD